jgi:hypothetical protein
MSRNAVSRCHRRRLKAVSPTNRADFLVEWTDAGDELGEQRRCGVAHAIDDGSDGRHEAREAQKLERRERLVGDAEMIQDFGEIFRSVKSETAGGFLEGCRGCRLF